MKGYLYILQKKDTNNTKVFKIGRTNNLERRLNEYNSKNEMPHKYQLFDGDIEFEGRFKEGTTEWADWHKKWNRDIPQIDKDNPKTIDSYITEGNPIEYDYVYTSKKLNDVKWGEELLKVFVTSDYDWYDRFNEHHRTSDFYQDNIGVGIVEWSRTWDGWFDEVTNYIKLIEKADRARKKYINEFDYSPQFHKIFNSN